MKQTTDKPVQKDRKTVQSARDVLSGKSKKGFFADRKSVV